MSNPDDPQSWIAKADNDLLNIRNNLEADRVPWDTVCFHAQQAAEKMLKAFLVCRGLEVPRTHDLIVLLAEAVAVEDSVRAVENECRMVAPYAVMLRYPGVGEDVMENEAREVVAAAGRITEQLRAVIV